jgi:molecular chaperone GrpE
VEEEMNLDGSEEFDGAEGGGGSSQEGAGGLPEIELDPEAVAALHQELGECRSKRDEYLDGWQRALADFSNYKKRIERDQAEAYQRAASRAAGRLLSVLDDLELALKDRPASGDGASWADGIDLIVRKILGYLETDGIVAMDAQGAEFDPNFHEAVSMEEDKNFESGQIIEVLQSGYMQNERVIRPARVRVAR